MSITSDELSRSASRVDVRSVSRRFDTGLVAIDGMDLHVAPGEFLAILGPSGSGKSTLLRLIAGLDKPTAGQIEVSHPSQIAYVFQDAHLLPWRNVLRNVVLPLEFGARYCSAGARVPRTTMLDEAEPIENASGDTGRRPVFDAPSVTNVGRKLSSHSHGVQARVTGRPLADARRTFVRNRKSAAREALARVGLADVESLYPAQLSGGMRMRVSLARALVTQPKLLLLDEPFAALDEITRQQLDEQLRGLWQATGMTVIFVTHSIMEATFLAERAVVVSRRPARIVLDHRLALPVDRTANLRGTPEFAMEMGTLLAALQAGMEPA